MDAVRQIEQSNGRQSVVSQLRWGEQRRGQEALAKAKQVAAAKAILEIPGAFSAEHAARCSRCGGDIERHMAVVDVSKSGAKRRKVCHAVCTLA